MRVLLIGANGQLGHDVRRVWPIERPSDELVCLDHGQIEVADLVSVRAAVGAARPDLVVNTAAYHRTDEVESQPERAFAVNAVGARNLALACREADAVLMHLSTDYVFGGRKPTPYVEDDPVDPINVYGVTKAAGEMLVRATWPRHFVVRSSGLYGVAGSSGKGGNFVETMLRLAREGRPIRVVDDQTLTPTPTRELARQLAVLAGTERHGTYHATCQGEASWHAFAAEIFHQAGLSPALSSQSTAESGAAAPRPHYSVLDNRALRRAGIDVLPDWRDGLAGYLAERQTATPTDVGGRG